jgi:hypothetical protein
MSLWTIVPKFLVAISISSDDDGGVFAPCWGTSELTSTPATEQDSWVAWTPDDSEGADSGITAIINM